MRYYKITTIGRHQDWGGEPTHWLEVNEDGDAERQIIDYPNGNVVSYDTMHTEDAHGALPVMVVDGDAEWWEPYAISREVFEDKWKVHRPLNRTI